MATDPQTPLLPTTNGGVHLMLLKAPDFTKEAQFTLEEGHPHTSQETLLLQPSSPQFLAGLCRGPSLGLQASR